jgi:glycosyltransferase involved in cell wall biosynthesis
LNGSCARDMLRVIYDVSVFGLAHAYPHARAGIHRVVESVARGLAASKECSLSFCATALPQSVDDSWAYLQSSEEFRRVPFHGRGLDRVIPEKLQSLNAKIETAAPAKRLLLKSARRTLLYANKHVRPTLPIAPSALKRADVFHSPYYSIPADVRAVKGLKRFVTVYDLIPILYPQFCGEGVAEGARKILESVGRDDGFICISQATKDDLCNYKSEIDASRVFVTHLAASDFFYRCTDPDRISLVREKYRIPNAPYLLSLSTLEPRKNIDHIIRSFVRLIQEQRIKDLYLVLTGNKGWKYEQIFETLSGCKPARDRIILTGYVADEDLAALYSGALAFVYPSFYEGFGLPPLEAMQCGTPVITSNASSLPEVVGDAGIMLDPTDIEGLCHSMLSIYESQALRESMSEKSLERAKRFNWEKCVRETIGAYKTLPG